MPRTTWRQKQDRTGLPTPATYSGIVIGSGEQHTEQNKQFFLRKSTHSPEVIAQAMAALREGQPTSHVSQSLGIPKRTLTRWRKREHDQIRFQKMQNQGIMSVWNPSENLLENQPGTSQSQDTLESFTEQDLKDML